MSERIEALKECFGKYEDYDFSLSGKRIRLLYTDDKYTNLKRNDEGIIELIHKHSDGEHQVWVKWDNGSSLMLLTGKDQYEVVQ